MVFSSLFFTFVFFVVTMAIYLAVWKFSSSLRAGNIVLLCASLIFYAWGGPLLLFLLCGMTFICWGGAILLSRAQSPRLRKFWFVLTLVLCLGLLGYFKYANLLVSTFCSLFSVQDNLTEIVLPIGISFYTFQLITYVVDVHRGEVEAQKKYWLLLLYASLFHQCIAGPIVRYQDVEREITGRVLDKNEISRGITRFTVGLAKKSVLANFCATIVDECLPISLEAVSSATMQMTFMGGLFYMFQIYLDFSAYSDMAIGMGLMAGFHYRENFNYPYTADSVSDFWRRWHISLGSFFRDYVYIPMGGNRVSVPRHILNLLVVWALTGFWHGASWNYLLWGLYFFVFLVLEKYLFRFEKTPDRFTRGLRCLYTLTVVYFGWFLFRFEDMSLLGPALASLLGAHGTFSKAGWIVLKNNLVFLAVAVLACTPVIPFVKGKLEVWSRRSRSVYQICSVLDIVLPVVLLFVSMISLVGDTYNPFMYTRF